MTQLLETRASSTACKFRLHPTLQLNTNTGAVAVARSSAVSKMPRPHMIQMRRDPAVLHISLRSSARLAAQLVVQ